MNRKPVEIYLPSDYLESIDKNISLVIMGKDPYPTNPTNIPFCKGSWKEQTMWNCSGKFVLQSLGFMVDELKFEYSCPRSLFQSLAENGIVFLNLSYQYVGRSLVMKDDAEMIKKYTQINLPFLTAAKTILACGEAKRIIWSREREIKEMYQIEKILNVTHPDIRNRNSIYPKTKLGWENYWGENKLWEKYNIPIGLAGHISRSLEV